MSKQKPNTKSIKVIIGLVLSSISVVVLAGLFDKSRFTTDPVDAAGPGWIASCNFSHSLPDDPIVSPGRPGAAHMHDFIGSTITNTDSTVASLHAGGTTCFIQSDKSAYWVPALFRDNVRVQPTGTNKNALSKFTPSQQFGNIKLITITPDEHCAGGSGMSLPDPGPHLNWMRPVLIASFSAGDEAC